MSFRDWCLDTLAEPMRERTSQLGFYFLVMLIKVKSETEKP